MRTAVILLVVLCTAYSATLAAEPPIERPSQANAEPQLLDPGHIVPEATSGSSLVPRMAVDCPDTFVLFGGEGTQEGKFETVNLVPDMQGWTGVDFTFAPNYWQVSTFNAENINNHGAGNKAMWCGQDATQQPGWRTPPGYGNAWNQALVWTSGPLLDTTAPNTVTLDFFFNHDTEPFFDFFIVEYDSAGTWNEVLVLDGTNKDELDVFPAPGVQYSTLSAEPIVFAGNDYGGDANNEIVIRLRFESDAGYSDSDGLFDSDGAVQVDDLTVEWTDGGVDKSSFEDFEGLAPYDWTGPVLPFAGDFAKIFPIFRDIDPCAENPTTSAGFIDDGTPPRNAPTQSTGGALDPNWDYGVPGGWVVNYTGGISYGETGLHNGFTTPPIPWDIPGECDDGGDVITLAVRFDAYTHAWYNVLPYQAFRYSTDGGTVWSDWRGMGVSWWYGYSEWLEFDLLLDLPYGVFPTHVQFMVYVQDVGDIFPFLPIGGTPVWMVDNVKVMKVRVGGPRIATGSARAQDGFPVNGSIAVATQAQREALHVPIFPWSDRLPEGLTPEGAEMNDHLLAVVAAEVPGTEVTDVRLEWLLEKNPLFDDVRQVPTRAIDVNVDTSVPGIWRGEVLGELLDGDMTDGDWALDLPDSNFLYPGDTLRYAIYATDTDGRVSSAPADVTGFETGEGYAFDYEISGLPTITDLDGTQPPMLVYLRGASWNSGEILHALGELGYVEGVDYDTYYYVQPNTLNFTWHGIGSAGSHGATADQLANYQVILTDAGDYGDSYPVLWDGSDGYSDDLEVLSQWLTLAGDRGFGLLGSNTGQSLLLADYGTPAGQIFLNETLGAILVGGNARDFDGNQQNPVIEAVDPAFSQDFVALGVCSPTAGHDALGAGSGGWGAHAYLDRDGIGVPTIWASILKETTVGDDTKRTLLIAASPSEVTDLREPSGTGVSARTAYLQEIIDFLGDVTPSGPSVNTNLPRPLLSSIETYPNPFNPTLAIEFTLGRKAQTRVNIYNVRGERVVTLVDGELDSGLQRLVWHGRDGNDRLVASGVYLYEVVADNVKKTGKVALVR